MSTESTHFLIFLIGLMASYLGSFSSGGVSVLGVWLLTLLGISPQMATITFKLGKIGDALGGVGVFHRGGHIPYRYLLGASTSSVFWSFIGSYIIFAIPDRIIYWVSALSMLFLSYVSWRWKLWITGEHTIPRKREFLYYIAVFFVTLAWNIFIAGSGIWYYFLNTYLLKLTSIEAKGHSTAVTLFWFIGTTLWVISQGRYVLSWAVVLALGMLIGWYFGSKHVIKIGNFALRNILLVSIVGFSLYFLFLALYG